MVKMTKEAVVEALERLNPRGKREDIMLFASFFLDFQEAEINIREHGTIVAHPRTAAPIDNPYLRIKQVSAAAMRKFKLKSGELWT